MTFQKHILFAFLYGLCLLTSCAQSGSSSIDQRDTSSVFYYLEKEPRIASDKPPLLILLHGVGSNEKDLFGLAGQLPGNYRIVSARAPIELQEGSYAWFRFDMVDGVRIAHEDEAERTRLQLIRFVEQMSKKYNTPFDKIYLLGFSQGAIMSYSVSLTSPKSVRGILALSGGILPSLKNVVKPNDELKDLRLFIAHGTADEVLPLSRAIDARAYVESLGIIPSYYEYRGMAHSISREELLDINTWLKTENEN